MPLALRSNVQYYAEPASERPSGFLGTCIDVAVAQLRARPGALWQSLLSLPVDEQITQVFERARDERSSPFALPADVIFPSERYPFDIILDRENDVELLIEDAESLQSLRQALSGEWENLPASDEAHQFAMELRDAGTFVAPRTRLACDRPGIYRLQHASVLFRSASGTGILTDPVAGMSDIDWILPADIRNVDAVLISHSHGDHFSLLTLMQFPKETIIIVPKVARSSMLCPDMAALLREAGFVNVVAMPWYSHIRIKDIDVHVYPFYGEQPWLTFAAPVEDLRNHGNTYAVDMDGHKTWFLIDSGHEFGHSMNEVCETVRQDLGGIDIVLSNLRSFYWNPKQIDGSGRYLFCFPAGALEDPSSWPTGLITFGPEGMHSFLSELKPRYFLPYAHLWHPPEQARHTIDDLDSEAEMLDTVRRGGPRELVTDLRLWQVGNRIEWKHSEMSICSALDDRRP